jgi:urease accessory protein
LRPLAVLLHLSDSALPTGGFSHSLGFEHYVHTGEIHDAASFAAWLHVLVARQLTYTDALLMRMLYGGVAELELTDRAVAATLPTEVRAADAAMAARIRQIGEVALDMPTTRSEPAHPAIEFARITRHFDIPLDHAIVGHLTATVITLTQNAVRGIPIGQTAGQRVVTAAHAWVDAAASGVHDLDPADLGAVAPGLEIAQMRHARLHARMFMS